MRHQLNQISALAEAGDLDNLKAYLAKTVSRIPDLDMNFCENRAADSVVGYYCALAKREGVPFCAKLDLPQVLPVDEIDLCLDQYDYKNDHSNIPMYFCFSSSFCCHLLNLPSPERCSI